MKINGSTAWNALYSLIFALSFLSANAHTELILNGGFESGSGSSVPNWNVAGGAALNGAAGSSAYAHSGSHYMILGGATYEVDYVYQTITVPSGATTVTLSFWENITSQETTTTYAYDTMAITIRNTSGTVLQTIANYSNLNKDSALGIWHQKTADLSSYKGQTIEIYFASTNDSSLITSFDIDDVSVQATVPAPAPSISSVSPNPVTGTNGAQPFYINGANFVSGCNVTLRDLTAGQTFANRTIVSFSSTQIELTPNFTTAMDNWSVEVINPDSQSSGQFSFNVVLPNLVPQNITLSTNSVVEGGTLTVNWTLANTGSGNSPGTVTGVRINQSSTSFSGTTLTNVPMPALSGNSSTSQSAQLTVPTTPGTYYVWIIADNVSSGAIAQSNYSDDEQHSAAFTVTAPTQLPNLVPQNITLSTNSVAPGGTLTVNWTLANTGSGNSPSTVTGVRINQSSTSFSGTTLTNVPMPALAGNSSTSQSAQLTVPATPGTYYVWIIADNVTNGAIVQTDYSDDEQHSSAFAITGGSNGTNLVFGLDTSSIQQGGTIDWNAVKSSTVTYSSQNYPMTFVILRASKGNADWDTYCRFKDPAFTTSAAAATNAGLIVSAYHVAGVTNTTTGDYYSPVSEADFFVGIAGNWIKPGNMRPFLDVEDDPPGSGCDTHRSTFPGLATWVDQWMQEVKNLTGVTPIIYCDRYFATNVLQSLATKYDLWVAIPGADLSLIQVVPSWNLDLIQYQAGTPLGIGGDMDAFQGNQQSFQSKLIIPSTGGSGSSAPVISNPKLTGTTFTLSASDTQVGTNYVLEFKNFLSDAVWTPIQTNSGNGGMMNLTNTGTVGPSRFYRIRIQ